METVSNLIIIFFQVGLAINPETAVEAMLPYVDHIDTALVMTVKPGFGGQKFMSDMMPKVRICYRTNLILCNIYNYIHQYFLHCNSLLLCIFS